MLSIPSSHSWRSTAALRTAGVLFSGILEAVSTQSTSPRLFHAFRFLLRQPCIGLKAYNFPSVAHRSSTRYRPTVIPVHESILYFMARESKDLLGAADPTLAEVEAHSLSLANTVSVPQNDTILLDAENSIRLDFHPNQVQKDIELVHSSGRSKTMQPLLTLPVRSETRHVKVSLLPPRDMNTTRIRIMMTKTPKLFCILADADEDISTSIVEKDARALLPARQREHVSGNLYAWGRMRTTALGGLTAFHSANMTRIGNKKQRIFQ